MRAHWDLHPRALAHLEGGAAGNAVVVKRLLRDEEVDVSLRTLQRVFFQLVSRRYERGSMLITTNQTVTQWGHVFGDEMIAQAVLDRVLHHSHVVMIHGDSFRLRQMKRAGLLGAKKVSQ
jgi:hypothetical protein